MNFSHNSTILPSSPSIAKVTALAWSPNGRKLAAVTISRIVYLFDEAGALKEKFPTKPADPKGSKLYIVIGMVFSPDSTKLAVAQSDDIIFIYKLGLDWGDKKSICNKFQQTVPINTILWPRSNQNEIIFALSDGKVKAGQLRTNRTTTLCSHSACSPAVSLACSPDGCTCLVGHLDGSIYRFVHDKASGVPAVKFIDHGSVPTLLGWGKSIVVASCESKVTFYDLNGDILRVFDCAEEKSFASASFNSSGETVILGCFNGFRIFQLSGFGDIWEDFGRYDVPNLYSVSAVAWRPDGSQLAVGGLCGNVDLYDAYLKKERYSDKFEFNYISKNQVILTQIPTYTRMLLQSQYGWEILKMNIYMEQYLIAHTEETLLLGNLENFKLSEVIWHCSGNERFLLDNPSVCLIFDNGQLSLVEYGSNDVLATIHTDYLQESLISVRLNNKFSSTQTVKHVNSRVAYLIDVQTIQVKDLTSTDVTKTVSHSCEIVWLQLNPRASHLVFCDRRRQLHLFDLTNQEQVTLLNICSFVQWVPDSDVLIAQSQSNLYIWYSIQNSQHATKFRLKGDLEGVSQVEGHTEVLVYEGLNTVAYELDDALIHAGLALENFELDDALLTLETLDRTEETRFMWKQIGEKALQQTKLLCAEESYACLGDISRSEYLHKVNKQIKSSSIEPGQNDQDQYLVHVKLAALLQKWKEAEKILLDHGHVEDAIKMHIDCFRWKEALSISYGNNYPESEVLHKRHVQWLLETGQIEEAGKEKASSGDVISAIQIFLNGNLPGLGVDYFLNLPPNARQGSVLDSITSSLMDMGMLEKLGELMEGLGYLEQANNAYREGRCYRSAVNIALKHFKDSVPKLQEEWGDWEVSKNQMEEAINHYLEAGCVSKAIEASIASHQWNRAVQIVSQQKSEVAKPVYIRLARHFEKIKQLSEAERLFISAQRPDEAVRMYLKANKWELAQKVASQFLSQDETLSIYVNQAKEREASRNFKDAERLYVEVGQHDSAIKMYKNEGMFDNVIQLVAKFKKDGLKETHVYLAKELERKGMLRDAEQHYLEVNDWKSVLKMYSVSTMWEDALRIARTWGDDNVIKQVAYAWAITQRDNNGIQSLSKIGLLDQAIEYAVDVGAFNNAFHLCNAASSEKVHEVHLQFAKFLESKGRFKEAEDNFIKAKKPREAIDMYIHEQDWKAALRVADLFQPSAVGDIQISQAQRLSENNDLRNAEALFIQAKRPDLAINMYKSRNLWEDAIRVAQKFSPDRLSEIQYDFASFVQRKSGGIETVESLLAKAQAAESTHKFEEAVDLYLRVDLKSLPDMEKLKKVWFQAVDLAKQHVNGRLREVIHIVGNQLLRAGQHQEAAKLYLEHNDLEEGAYAYAMGGHWDEAKKVAESSRSPQLCQFIEERYKEHLLETRESESPSDIGNIQEAFDLYSDKDKVHELPVAMGSEVQKDFSARQAAHCLNNSQVSEAISVLSRYGLPYTQKGSEICGRITLQVLQSCNGNPDIMIAMQELRNFLLNYLKGAKVSEDQEAFKDLEVMLAPLTYMITRSSCQKKGLKELVAKLSISLLRHVENFAADQMFFEAGTACKEADWKEKAFVYFNQYLDIAEAIDDEETNITIDHPMLSRTDIPQTLLVPKKQSIDETKQEEIKDWVIQFSVNNQQLEGEKSSMTRECKACHEKVYEASLLCPNCMTQSRKCCVTGYPVEQESIIECQACHMLANRHDWSTFTRVFHHCPWCNESVV